MRLYTTLRSPYGRKVRIALLEKGIPHDLELVDLAARGDAWFARHPIGTVPLLELDGVDLPDSTVICETLEDRFPTPPLYEADRLRCRVLEQLADTAADRAVDAFRARRRGDEAEASRQLAAAERLLAELWRRRAGGDWPAGFSIADAGLISAVGYLGWRHGDGWRERLPGLAAWLDAQASRPSVAATAPRD